VTTDWIIRIFLLGIVHWVLAGFLLHDLAYRKKVFGGKKAPWAIIIALILCLGSLIYLLFHPQIVIPSFDQDDDLNNRRGK